MWIEHLSDNSFVIFIAVSRGPELQRELEIINEIVRGRDDCNVIISLANIEILTSSSIYHFVTLHNSLSNSGRRLVLCRVSLPTKGIFITLGLDSLFDFVDDVFAALAAIQNSQKQTSILSKSRNQS